MRVIVLNNYFLGTKNVNCYKKNINKKLFITKELFQNTQNLLQNFVENNKIIIYCTRSRKK